MPHRTIRTHTHTHTHTHTYIRTNVHMNIRMNIRTRKYSTPQHTHSVCVIAGESPSREHILEIPQNANGRARECAAAGRARTGVFTWRYARRRAYTRCVSVCCTVLLCVAVCCSVLQCVAVCCSVLQKRCARNRVCARCVAVWCRVLQCVAVCCRVLQSVAECFVVC